MQRTQKLKQITAVVNRAAEAQVLLENIAANTSDEVATEIAEDNDVFGALFPAYPAYLSDRDLTTHRFEHWIPPRSAKPEESKTNLSPSSTKVLYSPVLTLFK